MASASKNALTKSYNAGYERQKLGVSLSGNPYRLNSDLWKEWRRGWMDAKGNAWNEQKSS